MAIEEKELTRLHLPSKPSLSLWVAQVLLLEKLAAASDGTQQQMIRQMLQTPFFRISQQSFLRTSLFLSLLFSNREEKTKWVDDANADGKGKTQNNRRRQKNKKKRVKKLTVAKAKWVIEEELGTKPVTASIAAGNNTEDVKAINVRTADLRLFAAHYDNHLVGENHHLFRTLFCKKTSKQTKNSHQNPQFCLSFLSLSPLYSARTQASPERETRTREREEKQHVRSTGRLVQR